MVAADAGPMQIQLWEGEVLRCAGAMQRRAEVDTAPESWQKREPVAKGECGEAERRDWFSGKAQRDGA